MTGEQIAPLRTRVRTLVEALSGSEVRPDASPKTVAKGPNFRLGQLLTVYPRQALRCVGECKWDALDVWFGPREARLAA